MYARTRKNKSGSTSVFVVAAKRFKGKKHPRAIVVKSFGSSKDPAKIEQLYEEACKFAENSSYTPFLRINNEKDISSCQVKTIGFKDVYGNIFERYFAEKDMKLSLDYQMLRELILMRIAEPVSKLKTAEIAQDFNFTGITLNKIYKFMDTMTDPVIETIKQYVFTNSKKLINKDLNVLFYDLTTIYFENNTTSELKKFGFSKDGKSQHVQISLALIVTEFGLPIGYEIFPGNIYEGNTLLPFLKKLRNNYNINNITIVADSAMLSNANLQQLKLHNFNYIVAARFKNEKQSIIKQALEIKGYNKLNNDIRYKSIELEDVSLVVCHSTERKNKDVYDRKLSLKKLEKHLGKSAKNKLHGSLKKPYIKLSNQSTIILDEQKLKEVEQFDGYFGFYTNTKLEPAAVITQYRNLWQVEQTFRITKHNLAIRPVYHYKDRRIAAHFSICFLALALIRTTEYLLTTNGQHISPESLHKLLSQIKVVTIENKQQKFNIISDIPADIEPVYKALNISKLKTFSVQVTS